MAEDNVISLWPVENLELTGGVTLGFDADGRAHMVQSNITDAETLWLLKFAELRIMTEANDE